MFGDAGGGIVGPSRAKRWYLHKVEIIQQANPGDPCHDVQPTIENKMKVFHVFSLFVDFASIPLVLPPVPVQNGRNARAKT